MIQHYIQGTPNNERRNANGERRATSDEREKKRRQQPVCASMYVVYDVLIYNIIILFYM